MIKRFVVVQNSLKTVLLFRTHYIQKLLKLGTVSVIAPIDDIRVKVQLEEMGISVLPIPAMTGIFSKLSAIVLMNYFILKARLNKATIISHFVLTLIVTYPTLVPFNKRLVIYVEGLGSVFTKRALLRKILRFLVTKSHATRLFCNPSERHLIGLPTDVVTGGIGVDLTKFSPLSSEKSIEPFQLLFVGRLLKDKGVIDAIEVLKILLKRGHNAQLNLVGTIYPNNPSSLKQRDIDRFKEDLGEAINFIGFTDDVKVWYEKSHLMLLPSAREGFPVCVMEASAMGVPSIGYQVDGVKDAICCGKNGLLAKFGDIEQLADIAESFISASALQEYAINSKHYAKQHFNVEKKTKFLLNLLLSLSK